MMTGPELRTFRNSFELDQKAFAKRIGITVEHLSRMERGYKVVGMAVVRAVALLRILAKLEGRPSALAAELRVIAEEGLNG